jgi:autotransporter-associated beta strand protein
MIRTLLSLPAIAAGLLLTASTASAQTYTWNTAAPSSAWLSAGNWTGGTPGTFPGLSGNPGLANGTAADVAVFGTINGTLPSGAVAIDFAAAGNSLSLGAVHLTAEDSNVAVAPAAADAGLLRLNGATISATPNVLLANTSASRDLTILRSPVGSSFDVLGLRLGITNGAFLVNPGRSITVSAVISEDAAGSGLTVRGGGTVTLSGANTYTGTTTVFDGTLRLNGTDRLDPTTQVVIGGGGGISNRLVLVGDQTITRLTRQGAGNSDRVVGGAATFAPALTLNIPTGQVNGFTGFFGGTGANENNLRLVKDGGGRFVTTTPSTYAGGTTVRDGTLIMQGWLTGLGTGPLTMTPQGGGDPTFLVNAASSTQAFTNPVTVNAGAAGVAVVGSDNTGFTDSTPTTFSGAFTLNGPVTLRAGNAIATRFTGGFTGSGDIAVVSPGNLARMAEFIRLTGTNTFGNLAIGQNVTLRLGSGFDVMTNRYVPDAATISFAAGSRLELRPEGTDNEAVNALVSLTPGAGLIETVGGNTNTFFILTVGAGNGSGTFGGTIRQQADRSSIALVKAGTGTQTLTGANAYTGSTRIDAGTLLVTNSIDSATGSGQVTVNPGGTLGGTGRIAPGTAPPLARPVYLAGGTVQAGGTDTAAPTRTDVLTLTEGLTFDGPSTFRSTVGQSGGVGSAGRIDMTTGRFRKDDGGAADDMLTIRLTDDGTLDLSGSASYTITLLTYGGLGTIPGNTNLPTSNHFTLVAENFTFSGPVFWSLSGSALSITFTPVPEPGSVLGCAAAAAAGWAAARRRGRRSV